MSAFPFLSIFFIKIKNFSLIYWFAEIKSHCYDDYLPRVVVVTFHHLMR